MTKRPSPVDLPQRQIGFLLRDLAQRYAARFEFHAQALSLTLPQCRVLVHLEQSPGLSQARLAKLANIDAMAMVRLLDHMETEGLVERLADPEDRRARRVVLTSRAQPVLDEIWRLSARTRDETFAGVAQDQRVLFETLLQRIHANLCALVQE
jgi:DNA-binding MarR family transcriptional regulator